MVLFKSLKELNKIIVIGQVVGVHGIKGEVKIALFYPDIDFQNIKKVQLNERTFFIESFRFHKKKLLLKLTEVADRTAAELLAKQEVSVEKNLLSDDLLEKSSIIAKQVVDQEDKLLGTVSSLIETPAHDVLVVNNAAGEELLIPWVEKFVISIDDDKIIVNLTDLKEMP